MVGYFNQGLPFSAGAPIDEDGLHQRRAAGAWGWVKALDIRDQVLWGGIEWTPDGREAVTSKRLPYISPRFDVNQLGGHQSRDGVPAQGAFLSAAALCSRPYFYTQPELSVAAAQLESVETNTPQADPPAGPEAISVTPEEARAQYEVKFGTLEDAAWTALAEGVTDWEAWVAEQVTAVEAPADNADDTDEDPRQAQIDRLEQQLAEANARVEAATTNETAAVTASQTLQAQVDGIQRQLDESRLRGELTAAQLEGGRMWAPAAIEVLVAAQMDPAAGTPALLTFINDHGGVLPTYLVGEGAALAATSADGNDEEAWLVAKPITDEAKTKTREIAQADGCGLRTAYSKYLKAMNQGR
jgi:hypothetical protein